MARHPTASAYYHALWSGHDPYKLWQTAAAITVAIVKTEFAGDLNCFELDAQDPDTEEIEEDIQAITHQRDHHTRTVNHAYAIITLSSNPFANLYDGLMSVHQVLP
jgi:hypothetical protein